MWFFRSPQIVFGEDALLHLAEIKGKRAFVVTDVFIRKSGLLGLVLIQLEHAGMQIEVFDAVTPEPDATVFENGADVMEEFQPDWIVAVGGGSVIDAAKGMWALYENPDLELNALSPLENIILRERARLIAIPTTAGTGSEATYALVLTVPATSDTPELKLGLGHPSLTPDIAIVDPRMSAIMPPRLTADTGMDALVQAIEGYTATWHNEYTDGLCLTAIKLIWEYLPIAYDDGDDLEAREKMANAATLAGLGYINSMVGAAHSMAHAAGAIFKIPHGRACGIFLPYVVEFSGAADRPDEVETRYFDIVRHLGWAEKDETSASLRLANELRDLLKRLDMPTRLSECNILPLKFNNHLPAMVERAMNDTVLFTSPRQPNEAELRALFEKAF
jgi:alcohol dehydrogenase class IV